MAAKLTLWADQGFLTMFTSWNKQNPEADPIQCGRYRPDFAYEGHAHVVILEFDEYQHSDRLQACELKRMGDVSMGYGGRPVHWVRFNPDDYHVIGSDGRKTKEALADERRRLEVLYLTLQELLGSSSMEYCMTIHYLFFNPKPNTTKVACNDEFVQRVCFRTIEDYCVWVDGHGDGR